MSSPIRPAMTADEVAAAIGKKRSTVYTIEWLRRRAFVSGRRGWRWRPEDVELYMALQAVGDGGERAA